uniref:Uncharacterized protein n=1 Tax=Physcomitrium patens TaxID=3218 RepID=A0A2K1KG14_PHYPA|nr:hypothetical protein PHYPA_009105 [Physcomitrium patens]
MQRTGLSPLEVGRLSYMLYVSPYNVERLRASLLVNGNNARRLFPPLPQRLLARLLHLMLEAFEGER